MIRTTTILLGTTLLATLAATGAGAAATKGFVTVNDAKYPVTEAYIYEATWELPSPDGGPPKKLISINLSDTPFDVEALNGLGEPDIDIDLRNLDGALVLTLLVDTEGLLHMIKFAPPKAGTFSMLPVEETGVAFRREKGAAGAWTGHFTMAGDRRAHDFDPDNWPLITADVQFSAPLAPSREVVGQDLPAGGGEPGQAYIEFNRLIGGEAPAFRSTLRAALRRASERQPEQMSFAEVKLADATVTGGVTDGRRARVRVQGRLPNGDAAAFKVFMVLEPDGWKVDMMRPE